MRAPWTVKDRLLLCSPNRKTEMKRVNIFLIERQKDVQTVHVSFFVTYSWLTFWKKTGDILSTECRVHIFIAVKRLRTRRLRKRTWIPLSFLVNNNCYPCWHLRRRRGFRICRRVQGERRTPTVTLEMVVSPSISFVVSVTWDVFEEKVKDNPWPLQIITSCQGGTLFSCPRYPTDIDYDMQRKMMMNCSFCLVMWIVHFDTRRHVVLCCLCVLGSRRCRCRPSLGCHFHPSQSFLSPSRYLRIPFRVHCLKEKRTVRQNFLFPLLSFLVFPFSILYTHMSRSLGIVRRSCLLSLIFASFFHRLNCSAEYRNSSLLSNLPFVWTRRSSFTHYILSLLIVHTLVSGNFRQYNTRDW